MNRARPAAARGARPVVVCGTRAFHDPDAVVREFAGRAEIRYEDLSSPAAIRRATAGADAVVVATHVLARHLVESISSEVRVIGRTGVGMDTVDLDAAAEAGIAVFGEPDYGSAEVASHAVAMLLFLARRLGAADAFVRSGWNDEPPFTGIGPIDELVVGILGCGRIGRASVAALVPLVGSVLVFDPAPGELPDGAERVASLEELLERVGALLVHAPLTRNTHSMLGAPELARLAPGALLVNVSRGAIVVESALVDALVSGRLGGAALDVFESEPLPATSALREAPNTLFSPHCAAYSVRAARRLGSWTVEDALAYLETGRLEHGSIVVAGRR